MQVCLVENLRAALTIIDRAHNDEQRQISAHFRAQLRAVLAATLNNIVLLGRRENMPVGLTPLPGDKRLLIIENASLLCAIVTRTQTLISAGQHR